MQFVTKLFKKDTGLCLKSGNYAYHAHREVAYLNNRTSSYFVMGLVVLALIGIVAKFVANPIAFLKGIFIFLILGVIVFSLVRHFISRSPGKREHSAFRKAAKQSKKRLNSKDARKASSKIGSSGNVTTLKRPKSRTKDASHLTVIEGKKGKKKNRASL